MNFARTQRGHKLCANLTEVRFLMRADKTRTQRAGTHNPKQHIAPAPEFDTTETTSMVNRCVRTGQPVVSARGCPLCPRCVCTRHDIMRSWVSSVSALCPCAPRIRRVGLRCVRVMSAHLETRINRYVWMLCPFCVSVVSALSPRGPETLFAQTNMLSCCVRVVSARARLVGPGGASHSYPEHLSI